MTIELQFATAVIYTNDAAATVAFYERAIGLTPTYYDRELGFCPAGPRAIRNIVHVPSNLPGCFVEHKERRRLGQRSVFTP